MRTTVGRLGANAWERLKHMRMITPGIKQDAKISLPLFNITNYLNIKKRIYQFCNC